MTSETVSQKLVDAVCDNESTVLASLLCDGANPNCVIDAARLTPMHFAVTQSSIDSILLLLAAGADIYRENDEGITPFQKAIELGDKKILNIFFRVENSIIS